MIAIGGGGTGIGIDGVLGEEDMAAMVVIGIVEVAMAVTAAAVIIAVVGDVAVIGGGGRGGGNIQSGLKKNLLIPAWFGTHWRTSNSQAMVPSI